MESKKILYKEYVSIRKEPRNIKEEDVYLFDWCYSHKIHETTLLRLRNASILKNTVFSFRHFRFYTSFTHIFRVSKKTLLKRLLKFLLPSHTIEKGIWITDEWSGEYFHWMADALTRLLSCKEFMDEHVVLLPKRYEQISYVVQTLEILGYKPYYFDPSKKILVKDLLLPSHTAETGNFNHEAINGVRSEFLQHIPPTPFRKIYASRRKAGKRKVSNEEDVTGLLIKNGYEVHYFEDYSMQEKINILSETKALISLHGGGLTNMLFMPSGGKILELRNKNDGQYNIYFSLASDLNHDYYYLMNQGDSPDTNTVNITVELDKLQEVIYFMNL